MPITKNAKKALRVSLKKQAVNARLTKNLKEKMKLAEKAGATGTGDKKALLADAYSAIDKAAKRGVIKKNTAARRKAKVSKVLKSK
jgi:small subunit ribosomal protein S20